MSPLMKKLIGWSGFMLLTAIVPIGFLVVSSKFDFFGRYIFVGAFVWMWVFYFITKDWDEWGERDKRDKRDERDELE